MAILISSNNVINDDRSFSVIADTTLTRNGTPATGMIRYNTTLSEYEYYNGTIWGPIKVVTAAASDAYAWGYNASGRLGDNTTTNRSSPVSVVGGFTDWVQISGGNYHTAAVRANGTAWAWGNNERGRLGDGDTISKLSPVSVIGGFTDWVQIAGGDRHTVALRTNGTAWAWGSGSNGELGDGTTISKQSPVSVVGGFTDWVQISSSHVHIMAIRANGTAWGWGNGQRGKIGDNTVTGRSSPVSVIGGFTDWVQIAAGRDHTAAVRANGTAWCWGGNGGKLGDNTVTSRNSPVSVVGGFTDWVQIAASNHTAAVRANGTAWCWGYGSYGSLGDNNAITRSSPVSVVGGFTDWVQIAAGYSGNSAAVRANGTAWSWGRNNSGQLGDGTTTNRSSPVSVIGGFTDWVQIAAGGGRQTAAIRR